MIPTTVNSPNPLIDGNPDIAALADGRAAIAYQSRRADDEFDIMLRLREADGSLGPETRLDGDWTRARVPEATTLSDGSILLTWTADVSSAEGLRSQVLAQRFDAETGLGFSGVFVVADRAVEAGRFVDISVTARPEGGFVANLTQEVDADTVFAVDPRSSRFPDRFTRVEFDADDALFPSETGRAHEIPLADGGRATIANIKAWDQADRVLIASPDDEPYSGINYGILPRYERNLTWEYVDTSDDGGWRVPLLVDVDRRIVALDDGTAVLVVDNPILSPGPNFASLHAFILDREEPAYWQDYKYPAITFIPEDRIRREPMESYDVAPLDGGGFAAVWSDGADIRAQLFNAEGAPIGDNYVVAATDFPEARPSVTQLSDGDLLFGWQQNRDGDVDVLAREVAYTDMAEGTYTVVGVPFLEVEGEIVGVPRAEETLRAAGEVDTNYGIAGFEAQWFRRLPENSEWEAISGATELTYTLGAADIGHVIKLEGTVFGKTGLETPFQEEFQADGQLAEIGPAAQVVQRVVEIEGSAMPGATLMARAMLVDPDGPIVGPYFYQWFRDDAPIPGGFRPTYTVTPDDAGAELTVTIRFESEPGERETVEAEPLKIAGDPSPDDDLIIGSDGADRLDGLAGADTIDGGGGDDVLIANGADVMTGGSGADVFAFVLGADPGPARIADFVSIGPEADRIAIDDRFLGLGDGSVQPRPVSWPEIRDALAAARLDWSATDASRTEFVMSLEMGGSAGAVTVATVVGADGGPIDLGLENVLIF
ncbi:hypothetical protein [Jannaschia seohaensis]|uniref:Hemolysin type calcium-binding protein n=1 Tax=Jannaschia seohaensis TaxID=475081 RepID=A0A2Y9C2Z4_9RHOB|nr:hypothetical protein [Jannaschia seohaensis]PWJ13256.1 hypothetical protein BCF38_11418 [Jannaschia seohaensis]SSA50582.1 hypothetical protein SAMN05421539_11418 [Jannaschia seohaensis]